MSSLKSKFVKGFFWELLGKLSLQGIGFIVSVILTRILFPEDFGIIAIATVFMNFADLIMDFGFSRALIQRAEVTEKHYSTVFFINLVIGIALFFIVFSIAPLIGFLYDSDVLTLLIRILAANFIISAFGNITRAKLYREMNFKVISLVNIIASILSGVLALVLAYFDLGVWSLVWQSISVVLITNVTLKLIKKDDVFPKFHRKEAEELWHFSSRLFLSGVVDSIFLNLDQLVIGKALSTKTLGFYYRAKNLENFAFKYSAGTLANVLLPSLSKIQEEKERFTLIFHNIFHILALFSFFLCGLLFINAEEIVLLLFTEKWLGMVTYFQILIIGAFSSQIFSLIYNSLLSSGKATDYLKVNVFNKILLLLALPIIIYSDLRTYLYVFVAIQFVNLFIGIYFVQKIINVRRFFVTNLFKYLSIYAAIIQVSTLIKINDYTLISNVLLNSIAYVLIFILFFYLFARSGMTTAWKELTFFIRK